MFITLTKIQTEKATTLQSVVDNTDGKLYVALREFHYEVGYENVSSSAEIQLRSRARPPVDRQVEVPHGLYNFEQLAQVFSRAAPGSIFISINGATGMVDLTILDDIEIKLSKDFRRILGIDEKGWIGGKYAGDKMVQILPHKWLHIYLDQLSTSSNYVDDAGSTLLAIVPAAAGGIIDITPPCPMYKELERGTIHQLNIRILDEEGVVVRNRQSPIIAVLEIRENA